MSQKRFLVRHLGNLGDMIFFVPPALESLKKHHPGCHITVVVPWGFKETRKNPITRKRTEFWGNRNQGGFSLHLLMHDPHIDQLVHWHDTKMDRAGNTCHEDGQSFPTWSRDYYQEQKKSGDYDGVFELDFGLKVDDNPIAEVYKKIGLPNETYANYQIYFSESDRAVAAKVMKSAPTPRIVLIESLRGTPMRNWDLGKITALEKALKAKYATEPIWFGSRFAPEYQGRSLTLRENIATLLYCDLAIGVLSGPLHFAAATGLPTLALYSEHPIHRAAPAYFLNEYIAEERRKHRTLLAPQGREHKILKHDNPDPALTPAEQATQGFRDWMRPGRQSTKSSLAVLTVDEIMRVVQDMMQ